MSRIKPAGNLLIGDIIIEKDNKKEFFYKVRSIQFAACSPFKTHVTIETGQTWCYDQGSTVEVR